MQRQLQQAVAAGQTAVTAAQWQLAVYWPKCFKVECAACCPVLMSDKGVHVWAQSNLAVQLLLCNAQ